MVHAWHFPRLSDGAYVQASTPGEAEASVVVSQIAAVLGPSPDVPLERYVNQGRPTRVILEAAEDAGLVVVGSRGRDGFAELLLGSVSSQVAQHARCP